MTEPIANGRGRAAKNGRVTTNGLSTTNSHISSDAAGDSDPSRSVTTQNIGGLIGQAESLRTFLRNALEKNNELLANLKRRRQQNRMVQRDDRSTSEPQDTWRLIVGRSNSNIGGFIGSKKKAKFDSHSGHDRSGRPRRLGYRIMGRCHHRRCRAFRALGA